MQTPPRVHWDASPDSWYSLVVHNSAGFGSDGGFVHYLVTNVPGAAVSNGTVSADWVAPFALKINEDKNGLVRDDEDFFAPVTFLVFRQEGAVEIEGQNGCEEGIVGGFREEVK